MHVEVGAGHVGDLFEIERGGAHHECAEVSSVLADKNSDLRNRQVVCRNRNVMRCCREHGRSNRTRLRDGCVDVSAEGHRRGRG